MGDAPSLGKLSAPQKTGRQIRGDKGGRRSRPQRKRQPVEDEGGFEPDLSNQFSGDINMRLQDELAGLTNLWGGGQPQAPAQNDQQTEILRAMMQQWADPENRMIRPREAFMAEREGAIGPERMAQENYAARLASDPWAAGGLLEGRTARETMSPEAILASQGNNAMNQWAQRGAMKGINTEDLARFNRQAAAGRGYRTYT